MPLPSVKQYAHIIEEKQPSSLSTLLDHDFQLLENGPEKQYVFSVGTSAVVFKALKDGQYFAIRCFLRGELETFSRYQQLAAFLSDKPYSWKVPFEFLDNEILLDGQFYPVVKMEWVEGTPLNKFIDRYSVDNFTLSKLQRKLIELSASLEESGIGHGDLKYNNIILQNEGADIRLKLIDYDSMFIPAFRGKKNLETGSPGFQPLKRLASHFSETVDRFSIWVMLTTLEAVKTDARIWRDMEQGGFNNEHSLFSASDFFNPAGSAVFQRLKRFNNESLNFYLDKITSFSKTSDLALIEKPALYKESLIPPAPKWTPAPVPPSPNVPKPIPEKLYTVEVKTIPAGKDVVVRGIKKGITPLRLSLTQNEMALVELRNEGQRIPVVMKEGVSIYEFDFSKKAKEPAPAEQDEILEFRADKYFLQEGELATINWKVKGAGRIHISHLGDVMEKTGTKKIVMDRTTDYVLTVGSKNRSLTINVQPKPKPAPPQPLVKPPLPETMPDVLPQERTARNPTTRILLGLLIFGTVASASYFAFRPKASTLPENAEVTQANTAQAARTVTFTDAAVTSFLDDLYKSYNNRNLSSIISHYASAVNQYYDSKSLKKDSLATVIRDLFITPVSYSCAPDFTTMKLEKGDQTCKVIITIRERLKSDRDSRVERYTTTIEYVLDPTFKIISEKTPG